MSFIVNFAGNRDHYQVPLALAEGHALARLCTDFYFDRSAQSTVYRNVWSHLSRRSVDGLSAGQTRGNLAAIAIQSLRRAGFPSPLVDQATATLIARDARDEAIRSNADLFLYSATAHVAFKDRRLRDRRKILFCFHPHHAWNAEILRADLDRFPSLREHYLSEPDVSQSRFNRLLDEEIMLADDIVCASSFTARSVLARHATAKVCIVPYGAFDMTTPEAIAPAKAHAKPTKFLFVGQGVQRKGLHHLALAWRKAGLANARLDLVCTGLADPIRAMLPDNIALHDRLPAGDLARLYREAHVFVMPSLVEGFGLVYLEALSFGCHCIYTPNTGVPDLKPDANAGTEVAVGDLEGLAQALINCHRRVQSDEFDWASIVRFARQWPWMRFRQGIREAAGVVGGASG
jgi:glycosyltransferase involved in cell wall biosynthesis